MGKSVQERIAYLKGLAEGMELDAGKKEGRMLVAVIDVLGDIGDALKELTQSQADLSEMLDELTAEIGELYDDDEDDDDESHLNFYDDDDEDDDEDDNDDDEDDDAFIEYECPNCLNTVYYDADDFDLTRELKCPNCAKPLFVELQNSDDDE